MKIVLFVLFVTIFLVLFGTIFLAVLFSVLFVAALYNWHDLSLVWYCLMSFKTALINFLTLLPCLINKICQKSSVANHDFLPFKYFELLYKLDVSNLCSFCNRSIPAPLSTKNYNFVKQWYLSKGVPSSGCDHWRLRLLLSSGAQGSGNSFRFNGLWRSVGWDRRRCHWRSSRCCNSKVC